jgi:hypothetical protein
MVVLGTSSYDSSALHCRHGGEKQGGVEAA